jgi:hypothetical protein
MEESGQMKVSAALPVGKQPRFPFCGRLGGHQTRSGDGGEKKISAPARNLTPSVPASSLVTTVTELPPATSPNTVYSVIATLTCSLPEYEAGALATTPRFNLLHQ